MSDLVVSARAFDGSGYLLGVVVKRGYSLRPGARAAYDGEPVAIAQRAAVVSSSNPGAAPRMVDDEASLELQKPFTDVTVSGSAHAPGGRPVTSVETSIEVGAAKKSVRAIGARRVSVGANGALSFTDPAVFTATPLTWDFAYGGRDERAREVLFAPRRARAADIRPFTVAYPRNASGRGYYLDLERARLDGIEAPCLEDPSDAITADRLLSTGVSDWADRPVSACYDLVSPLSFPRLAWLVSVTLGESTRRLHELETGALGEADVAPNARASGAPSPRFYNAAPSGLAVSRLRGDERARLVNLHPSHATLDVDLPAERPDILLHVPGAGARRLAAELSAVRFCPDEDRVVLTWAASLRVLAPYSEEMMTSMKREITWKAAA